MKTFEQKNQLPAHSLAVKLRAAGYVPLPRLWVKTEDMPKIHEIAHQYQEEVTAIRREIHEALMDEIKQMETSTDPKLDKEAAWAAFEKTR